ncbi:MAG TPA: antibiotic biosynthesis monooxygenase [Bryobacteraceae bacterium]|nr:antibiotic biosynthesis monooxygenase [Bryobacteraceae bacterium]
MRRIGFAALALMAWINPSPIANAAGPGNKAFYVVTHIDVIGSGGNLAEAIRLVKEFVSDSRQDLGVIRFEAIQLEGHPNHFTLLEVWQSPTTFEAHLEAAHTRRFRQALQPMLGSPFRERLHHLVP